MRRLAIGIAVVAASLAGCSGDEPVASNGTAATSAPPIATPARGPEPKTAEQLRRIAQLHFNSFSVGDFDTFWDDFDADAKATIPKAEYVRRLTACMRNDPNKNKPFRVMNATENKDGTWSVEVRYVNFRIKFPARYENGRWKFSLSPDAKRALKLPMDQYLATQCAK